MAKKNFSGGLESLLGAAPPAALPTEKKSPSRQEPLVESSDLDLEKELEDFTTEELPKSEKTSQDEGQDLQSVFSFNQLKDLIGAESFERLEAVAKRDGISFDEILREAVLFYLDFQVEE